jgi:hypothetical protein
MESELFGITDAKMPLWPTSPSDGTAKGGLEADPPVQVGLVQIRGSWLDLRTIPPPSQIRCEPIVYRATPLLF